MSARLSRVVAPVDRTCAEYRAERRYGLYERLSLLGIGVLMVFMAAYAAREFIVTMVRAVQG